MSSVSSSKYVAMKFFIKFFGLKTRTNLFPLLVLLFHYCFFLFPLVLKSLHCLTVCFRMDFKILMINFFIACKCLAPYVADLLTPYKPLLLSLYSGHLLTHSPLVKVCGYFSKMQVSLRCFKLQIQQKFQCKWVICTFRCYKSLYKLCIALFSSTFETSCLAVS